jgi:hypothetical protein
VWIWSIVWWIVEDAAKVLCRFIVHKYNVFNINETGVMQLTASAAALKEKMISDAGKKPVIAHH